MDDEAHGRPTIDALLRKAARRLAEAGISEARLDARLLLQYCLGLDHAGLLLRSHERPDRPLVARYHALIGRRLAREPVHRIIGRRAFYGHEFELSPATLEPRPDTEALVELAAEALEETIARKGACRFVDVGTGTGAIAVSLLARFAPAEALATDISLDALATARRNAEGAGVAGRFFGVVADYLAGISGPFDLILSNPPYIPTEELDTLAPEVRQFDPRTALDGGADGLGAYRRIAEAAQMLGDLEAGIGVEIGWDQKEGVTAIFADCGFRLSATRRDLAGIERALLFKR